MGSHLHIYCRDADNKVCGMGAGSKSPCADIYLKLEFSVLLIPILASVSFRQLPPASVGSRGLLWAMENHRHLYCSDAVNNVFGRGVGSQSPRVDIYLKLEFSVPPIPILAHVSFRQLPRDSVDFRGEWATISTYIDAMQTTTYVGGGPEVKVPGLIFT